MNGASFFEGSGGPKSETAGPRELPDFKKCDKFPGQLAIYVRIRNGDSPCKCFSCCHHRFGLPMWLSDSHANTGTAHVCWCRLRRNPQFKHVRPLLLPTFPAYCLAESCTSCVVVYCLAGSSNFYVLPCYWWNFPCSAPLVKV